MSSPTPLTTLFGSDSSSSRALRIHCPRSRSDPDNSGSESSEEREGREGRREEAGG